MLKRYEGSCHCGAVQFEVDAPERLSLDRCNCSICTKSGFLHLIVPRARFRLLRGDEVLSSYRFGSLIAEHTFCKICGVKPFYTPRSNPDGVDVNAHCLDPLPVDFEVTAFDGQNWELNAHRLAHKSREL